MSDEKPPASLADLVVTALSPLLIMVLIGSLVFFLLEVLYVGNYSGRMQWTLFFFVFGAVLIGRIALTGAIAARSGLYALALGFLTWISLQAFVEYPSDSPMSRFSWIINAGLVVLIWWCAKRLTWDCTFLDEGIDPSGAGVLDSAGLDGTGTEQRTAGPVEEPTAEKKEEPGRQQTGLLAWWERYQRYRAARQQRPHTPGVWVVYFSLAALPLFGLGQALIPAAEEGRRRYAFWLLVLYTGSGLGLLLTTCFLGLRRYLRQRGLRMPGAMTGVWLTVGGILIACLLFAGALLPRPEAEYAPLGAISRMGSPARKASKTSPLRDGAGEPGTDGTPGKSESDDRGGKDGAGGDRAGKGQADGNPRGQARDGDGQPGGKQGENGSQGDRSGKASGGSGSSSNGAPGRQGERANDRARPGQENNRPAPGEHAQERQGENPDGKSAQGDDSGSSGSAKPPPSNLLAAVQSALAALSAVLKWVVIAVIGVLLGIALLRAVLQFLANFTAWADQLLRALRAWWQGLFGWLRRRQRQGPTVAAPLLEEPALPFASYPNPFHDPGARRRAPAELVRYTFEAFQAWARQHGLGRRPDETASEFAVRMGSELPVLDEDANRLAELYVLAAYAGGALSPTCLDTLEQFWEHLEAAVERPLSA